MVLVDNSYLQTRIETTQYYDTIIHPKQVQSNLELDQVIWSEVI